MNERKRRIGENEAVFRNVNEQISGVTTKLVAPVDTMRIVCECGARSCTEQFEIAPEDYERIRRDAELFVLKPGHDLPETETVVAKNDVYWTVRKDPGLPAAIAEATDPRS
jgi:hypothetical protein